MASAPTLQPWAPRGLQPSERETTLRPDSPGSVVATRHSCYACSEADHSTSCLDVDVEEDEPHSLSLHHVGAFSNLAKLPVELLAEVFSFGLSLAAQDGEDGTFLSCMASVCRFWRNVACGAAKFWTKLFLAINGVDDEEMLGRAAIYFERSKAMEIDLDISFGRFAYYGSFDSLKDVLAPHLHRCRSLRLSSDEMLTLRQFLPIRVPMERLQTLAIRCESSRSDPRIHPLFDKGASVPSLRDLSLIGPGTAVLSVAHVITAHVDVVHVEDIVPLNWCEDGGFLGPDSMVKRLQVDSHWAFWSRDAMGLPPLILPHVTTLRIASSPSCGFRKCLVTPNLQHLELTGESFGEDYETDEPMGFKLLSLTIGSGWQPRRVVDDSCTELFLAQPSIRTLEIHISTSRSIRSLLALTETISPQGDVLLPALEVIKLYCKGREVSINFVDILSVLLDSRPKLRIVWNEGYVQSPCVWVNVLFHKGQYSDRFVWERDVY